MSKVQAVAEPEQAWEEREAAALGFLNDVTLLTVPTSFFTLLSNEAAKRNLSLSEMVRRAISEYLERTRPSSSSALSGE